MKKLIRFAVVLTVLIGTSMSSQPVHANEIEEEDYGGSEELEVVTIYADLSNEEEVEKRVENEFNIHENKVVIEVRDYSELVNESISKLPIITRAVPDPFWQNNSRQYFIVDAIHATKGTIKGWVQGSKVSSVSGTVTVYGSGLSYVGRTYHNTTTTSAYMRWTVQMGGAQFHWTVPLFN